ncbi:hypothetical protein V6N13_106829 [Hibiscus sabdariffa]
MNSAKLFVWVLPVPPSPSSFYGVFRVCVRVAKRVWVLSPSYGCIVIVLIGLCCFHSAQPPLSFHCLNFALSNLIVVALVLLMSCRHR